MEVTLVVVGGKSSGQEVPLRGPKFLIGRAEDCHLRPQSSRVSRHHAAILIEDGFVAVRDLGSSNGTLVNGERIKSERELKTGDKLQIGPLEFEVQLAVSVRGKKKPKARNVQEAAARTVAAAADDELDIIGDWLDDEEEAATVPGVAGTGSLKTIPTAATKAASDAKPPDESEEEEEEEGPAKIVGQFDRGKKPVAESSQSAANEMLKQFFNRQ